MAANPLRESLRLTARSLGKDQPFDLRLRHLRPIYFDPVRVWAPDLLIPGGVDPFVGGLAAVPWGSLFLAGRPMEVPQFEAEFLMTDAESWNENQPFPTRERSPRYEPAKPDEVVSDPLEKKRQGPFPVGLAIEVPNRDPISAASPSTVRLAAIGHGGVFMGKPPLSPPQEKLLLDVSNWLLGRDERLTHKGEDWRFPRVALDPREKFLWRAGTQVGLPLLFLCLGLMVVQVRRHGASNVREARLLQEAGLLERIKQPSEKPGFSKKPGFWSGLNNRQRGPASPRSRASGAD